MGTGSSIMSNGKPDAADPPERKRDGMKSRRTGLLASLAALVAGWAMLVADSPDPCYGNGTCPQPSQLDVSGDGLAGDATPTAGDVTAVGDG